MHPSVSIGHLEDEDLLVSFDVVSLFTKVPINEALVEISQHLNEDEDLFEHVSIPVEDISSLVELCLRSTYFQLGD